MKNKTLITITSIILAAAGLAYSAQAAIYPSLSLSYCQTNNTVQITVSADANASVLLYYNLNQYNGAVFAGNIGYTNNDGYFYTAVSNGYDNIPANAWVYAVVDGVSSAQVLWPSYSNNYNNYAYYQNYQPYQPLSLSQNSLYLNSGQSGSVSVYGNGSYYISNNSNSSVVGASINGNILNVYGYNGGSANITVCQYNNGSCSSLFVNVAVAYVPPPVYYSPPPTIINYPSPPLMTTQYYNSPYSAQQPYHRNFSSQHYSYMRW